MELYIEIVIIINFIIDFILLFGMCVILRRETTLKRLVISSLIGSIVVISIFYKISNLYIILIKIFTSLIMVIICTNYKSLRYTLTNLFYFYTLNTILGGFIYLISIEIIKKYKELNFIYNNMYFNLILIVISSPIIIYIYIKQIRKIKNNYSNYYNIDIYLKNNESISLIAYLDTANKLIDPYKHRPIILVNKNKINFNYENLLLVPYDSLNNHGLLKCIIPEKIYINDIGVKTDFLIGIAEEQINIDGVDCILNPILMERTIL